MARGCKPDCPRVNAQTDYPPGIPLKLRALRMYDMQVSVAEHASW